MKKLLSLFLAITLLVLPLAGCAQSPSNTPTPTPTPAASATPSAGNKDSIKIGVIYEASGSLEDWGKQEHRGLTLGFEYATDGTFEIDGRKIEFFYEDSASNPSTATEKAIKLCETNKVDVLCGSTTTAVAQAVQAVALEYKVPYFIGCAAGDDICGANYNDYTFMIGRNVSQVAAALSVTLLNWGTDFAFMFADYAGGHQFADAYAQAVKALGGNIVYEEYPPLDCPDFTSYLMAAAAKKPDAMIIACTGNSFANILPNQFNELGLYKDFPLVADVTDKTNLRALGMASVGVQGCCLYYYNNWDTPENDWLIKRHEEVYGETVEFWSGNAFTCAIAVITALKSAGSTDAQDIIKAAEGMTYRGVKGDSYVRPEDHVSLQVLPVIELQDTGLDYPEPVVIRVLSWEECAPPIRNGK